MSFRNTKGKSLTVALPGYQLAKSDINHYLKFVNYDDEIFKTTSSLTSKPIISFYQSDSKVIIDYTLANTTDKKYLSSFFAKMDKSNQFNITKASYLNESELQANLGCTLTYELFKENKIFASVNSVILKNPGIDFYDGNYFIEAPQLSKAGSLNFDVTTKNMALVSVSPKTDSLISLGIQIGDSIEVINSSSSNNKKTFTIKQIEVIKGQEIISLNEETVVAESLLGIPSIVNFYIKSDYKGDVKNLNDSNIGCCFTGTDEQLRTYLNRATINPELIQQINSEAINITGFLLPNNTEKQCILRTGKPNNFFPNCSFSVTNLDVSPDVRKQYVPSQLDTVFYVASNNVIDVSFSINKFIFKKSLNDLNNTLYYEYNEQENILYLTTDLMFRFDQLNPTNSEKIIRFSLDENKTMLYQTNIFGKFTSTGKDSLFYVKLTSDTPDLYMFVENNQTISPVKIVKLA